MFAFPCVSAFVCVCVPVCVHLWKRVSGGKQHIFRFQIAVYDVLKVQVPQGYKNLQTHTQQHKQVMLVQTHKQQHFKVKF